MNESRSWTRFKWLRVSLRAFLVVFTIVGICFAIYVHGVNQQRRVVESIREQGGEVDYLLAPERASWVTPRLKGLLGDDFFLQPEGVALRGKHVTDDVLSDVARLRSLKHISLREVSITDEGLNKLTSLRELEGLVCIRDPKNTIVLNELSRRAPRLGELDSYLPDILDELAIYHPELEFQFDREVLRQAGFDEWETPFSWTVKGRTPRLMKGLDELLSQHGLGWVVDDGVVLITTVQKSDEIRQSKIRQFHDASPDLRKLTVDWGND